MLHNLPDVRKDSGIQGSFAKETFSLRPSVEQSSECRVKCEKIPKIAKCHFSHHSLRDSQLYVTEEFRSFARGNLRN